MRFSVVGAPGAPGGVGGAGGALVAGGGADRVESHPVKLCGVTCCWPSQLGTGFLTGTFSAKMTGLARLLGGPPRLSDHVIAVASQRDAAFRFETQRCFHDLALRRFDFGEPHAPQVGQVVFDVLGGT